MQGLSLFQLSAGPLGTVSIFWFYYTLELFLMYQFDDINTWSYGAKCTSWMVIYLVQHPKQDKIYY